MEAFARRNGKSAYRKGEEGETLMFFIIDFEQISLSNSDRYIFDYK